MRYIEIDRKRRPSTIRDYRREIEKRLIPEFGEHTRLSAITTAEVESFRERMVAEGVLSARTINKRLQQLHSIFKRAQRVWELPSNPVANAERQPQRRSGDFAALEAHEVTLLAEHAVTEQDGVLFTVAAFSGLRLGELRGLRWSEFDWTRRVIFRFGAPTPSTRTGRPSRARSGRCRWSTRRLARSTSSAVASTGPQTRTACSSTTSASTSRTRHCADASTGPSTRPACRTSASTTCATPSGRSPSRRSLPT
jgi:integrase